MTNFLARSDAVTRIEASSLRRTLPQSSEDTISLAVGEPDFSTPAAITEAACQALFDGYTYYAPDQGYPDLRDAVAQRVAARAARHYGPEHVLITHGACGGLASAILGMINPGDRVIAPDPTYSLYADLVHLAGGQFEQVPVGGDLHWDLDRLRQAAHGAKMFIYCNPCNPTGIVHTGAELKALADIAEDNNLVVLADEAYSELVYDDEPFPSMLSFDALAERAIYCQTFSKAYAMTGWRIGYLAGPQPVIAAATRIHATFNGSLNSAVQRAALAALALPEEVMKDLAGPFRRRRALILRELASVPTLSFTAPTGGFYVFPSYRAQKTSAQVAAELRARGLAVRAGREFGPGGEGHLRLSYSASDEAIVEGLRRLRSYFS